MGRIEPIRTKEDLIIFLIAVIIATIYIYAGSMDLNGVFYCVGWMFFTYFVVSLPSWIRMQCGMVDIMKRCKNYLEENKVKIGLFVRPSINKNKITLANKYCAISFSIQNAITNIKILDKISGQEKTIKTNKTFYDILTSKNNISWIYSIFLLICDSFNYDITADELEQKCQKKHPFIFKWSIKKKIHKKLFLDINKASEAELTAIPGVTIAKAKHAVKMRDKYAFYLSVNQFFETINLGEEFVEQIQFKGNKILLNELPEYKKIEIRRENNE